MEYLKYSVSLVGVIGLVLIVIYGDFGVNIDFWLYINFGVGIEVVWLIVSEDGKIWGFDFYFVLYFL